MQVAASLSSACLSVEASGASPRKRLNGPLCSRPAACSAACSDVTERAGKSRSVAHLYSCCLWRHCASGAATSGRCSAGQSLRRLPVKRRAARRHNGRDADAAERGPQRPLFFHGREAYSREWGASGRHAEGSGQRTTDLSTSAESRDDEPRKHSLHILHGQ